MKHKITKIILVSVLAVLAACTGKNDKSDAYGNFEAVETIISAEAQGKLSEFTIQEGDELDSGLVVGIIDTTQLYFQKQQLEARRNAAAAKIKSVLAQINVLNEEKSVASNDLNRIKKMLADGAATQKQFDDLSGRISVIDKNINAIETQNSPILNEVKALDAQIGQLSDLIKKCYIVNPIKGMVLGKYAERYEISVPGKSLYKIADLNSMILRIYISGSQLANIKLGQKVKVLVDKDAENNRTLSGEIIWISSKSEFTPKIIQTKEERVNMVYAIKILVKNDGFLKIGMPGEAMLIEN